MKNFTEFNQQAADYVKYRPTYPREIFEFLRQVVPSHEIAYDVGTGNGQCAVGLSEYFDQVYASDLSNEQISKAIAKKNIRYFVAPAHASMIDSSTVDLVTVATAVHWFDFDLFYKECRRILKRDGVIAAWAYGWHECETPEVTELIQVLGKEILESYWSPQPKLIWDEYKTIPFPFEEIAHPKFTQKLTWNLNDLVGYLTTWSASQKYLEARGKPATSEIFDRLLKSWGDPLVKLKFECPLHMRIGRDIS